MAIYKQITANAVILSDFPFIKELAMEAYLYENEKILKLDDKYFSDVTCLDAEISLKNGGKGKDGRIDLLVKYSDDFLGIVELKAGEINEKTVTQLKDYLNQREQILKNVNYWNEDKKPQWVGVLVGTDISSELREKLTKGYSYENIPIAGMTIKRYRNPNNGEIFVISDTYFNFPYNKKDGQSFRFNNNYYYSATKLVNSVIRYYLDIHPNTSFAELKQKFPDKLALSNYGVFAKIDDAANYSDNSYLMQPEDIIYLPAEKIKICTCNFWRRTQMPDFIANAKKIGIEIEQIKIK